MTNTSTTCVRKPDPPLCEKMSLNRQCRYSERSRSRHSGRSRTISPCPSTPLRVTQGGNAVELRDGLRKIPPNPPFF